jgi:hypothetical protein
VIVFQLKLNAADRQKALDVLDKLASSDTSDVASRFEAAGGTFYGDPTSGVSIGVTSDRFMVVFDGGLKPPKERVEGTTSTLGKGIGSTTEWRDRSKHLPRDSNVIFYADTTAIRDVAERSMLTGSDRQDYESTAAPLIRPIKYILMGSATQANREGSLSRNHTVLFVGVGK